MILITSVPMPPADPRPTAMELGLGLMEATALLVGGAIGASSFLVPSAVARAAGSRGLSLLTRGLRPGQSLVGIAIVLAGLPFYFYWSRWAPSRSEGRG